MKTFEDFGVALGEAPKQYDTDAIELAVAVYSTLGLIADEGRAREAFTQEISALQSALPELVTNQAHDIVLAPRLGELSLDALIERYDEPIVSKGNPSTYIWESLWSKYSSEELNQRQTSDIEAHAVLLGGENDYDEPGLYFAGRNLKQQRKSLEAVKAAYSGESTVMSGVSVASYIIRNAMQLERGEQLQDRPTFTRFIELDEKRVDGISRVPRASSYDGGRLRLDGSRGVARSYGGVRLSVGLSS